MFPILAFVGTGQCKGLSRFGLHPSFRTAFSSREPEHNHQAGALKGGVFSELKPPGFILLDGRRSDGKTIAPYRSGEKLVWYATFTCALALHNPNSSTAKVGSAAHNAEAKY